MPLPGGRLVTRLRRAHGIALALMVGFAAACGGGNTPAKSVEAGTVTIRVNGAFGSFDPGFAALGGQNQVTGAAYDSLLAFDSSGKLVGDLAKSWIIMPTSITATLKSGVKCSDGTPITPSIVVESFKHFYATSQYVTQAFGQKTVTFASSDSAGTVTITLSTPFNEAVYGLAQRYLGVICPAGLAPGADFLKNTYGSGEYTLASVTPDTAVMKVHKEWTWGPFGTNGTNPAVPREIDFKVITNETTAANLLLTNGLDLGTISGPDNVRLQAEKKLARRPAIVFNPWYLMPNEASGRVTADSQVRKAIFQTVNQKGWNQAALGGFGVTSGSIFTPKANCYEDTSKLIPPVSVSAARATLQADGYAGGSSGPLSKDGKALTIEVTATTGEGSGGEYLVNQLTQAGFTAKLNNLDTLAYSKAFQSGNFDILVGLFGNQLPNPGADMNWFHGSPPPKGQNVQNLSDQVLADAIQKALTAPESERCTDWKVVQERFLTQYHMLPIAAPAAQWYSQPGWSFTAIATYVDTRSLVRTA